MVWCSFMWSVKKWQFIICWSSCKSKSSVGYNVLDHYRSSNFIKSKAQHTFECRLTTFGTILLDVELSRYFYQGITYDEFISKDIRKKPMWSIQISFSLVRYFPSISWFFHFLQAIIITSEELLIMLQRQTGLAYVKSHLIWKYLIFWIDRNKTWAGPYY
jgi:hypothetical protein